MTKEELAKQYANRKVTKKGQYVDCDFDVRKELTAFNGYEVEQAFKDGYDKAIEVACELIEQRLHFEVVGYPVCLPDQFVEDFKAHIEEGL